MQAEIKGTTMPVLEVTVQPGEQLISTHGELSWMTANMQMSQTAGGGGFLGGLKRVMGGGGIFLTRYEPFPTSSQRSLDRGPGIGRLV